MVMKSVVQQMEVDEPVDIEKAQVNIERGPFFTFFWVFFVVFCFPVVLLQLLTGVILAATLAGIAWLPRYYYLAKVFFTRDFRFDHFGDHPSSEIIRPCVWPIRI